LKSFNPEKYKKILIRKTFENMFFLIVVVMFLIPIGLVCFYFVFFFFENYNFQDFYNFIFAEEDEPIEKVLARYSVSYISFLVCVATLLYGLILFGLRRINRVAKFYSNSRDQIYELLTMSIFLFGFIPLFLKFIIIKDQVKVLSEIDNLTVGFFMGVASPYLYSIISKIYRITYDKQFQKAMDTHLYEKFKR